MKSAFPFLILSPFLVTSANAQESSPAGPALSPKISSQLQHLLHNALNAPRSGASACPTTFTPAQESLFLDNMLSRLTLDAAQQKQFRAYVAQVSNLVETAYQENGFARHDLGVALAGLLEVCYELDQGTFKLTSLSLNEAAENKRRTHASVQQMQYALGCTPEFKSLPDQNKQIAYEFCTFMTGHLAVSWQQAGQDTDKQNAARQMARQQLQTLFKIAPDGLTRNAAGEFVPKDNPAAPETAHTKGVPAEAAKSAPVTKEANAPIAAGHIERGGPIQEGVYAGDQFYGKKLRDRYRLYLYKNGQYRLYDKEGEMVSNTAAERFTYDAHTGKLDLAYGQQYMMFNGVNPKEDFCFYGRGADGQPFVLASSDRGFSLANTLLRYAGPIDKPAPEAERQAKAAAEVEAKRYKWVVPVGQGLKPEQIAGILLNQDVHQFYNGSGLSVSMTYDLYLLLNDGTVYNGLPVAPDELDVSLSRRKEPEKWGHWKRQGSAYVAAWSDAPGQFKPLKGSLVKPGGKGQRLAGRFGAGETSGSLLGSSYRLWGVSFTPDGRFVKDNWGGSGSNMTAQTSGLASVNSTYDDKGSYTSASGSNFVVGSGKKNSPNGDRSGTYSLDGYTLTLHYDNGHSERLPFFFKDTKQEEIWFEGATLGRDTEKK